MKPATDASWKELARQAGVRPSHVFHLAHWRKLMGDRFSVEGFCDFAMLERKHVDAMLAVLPDPVERKARSVTSRTQLADGFTLPEEWLLLGREKRFWPMDVCRTEAEKFVNWHRMKGTQNADWKAAWRNWIDGSRREDGRATVEPEAEWTPERRAAYAASLR